MKLGDQAIDKDAELLSTHEQKRAQLKRKKQTGKSKTLNVSVHKEREDACRETQTIRHHGEAAGIQRE